MQRKSSASQTGKSLRVQKTSRQIRRQKVLCNLEQAFLHLVKQNVNVTDMLAARRDDLKDKIIIIDDISQGVVPMDKTLRAWREATGRAMLYLSEEADEVYRVFCGIGQKIK